MCPKRNQLFVYPHSIFVINIILRFTDKQENISKGCGGRGWGRDSSVSTATGYGMDGPGIEFQ
jgi:hypothetical protein